MTEHKNIYDFIKSEETAYQTLPVPVIEGYEWNMFDHIKKTVLYKNSQYTTGKDDNKPYMNIMRPILNLQYRAEGFDVKDIVLFINDKYKYFKSFLAKKFHEKWARENKIDTFIDDFVESYVDFGGVLIKDVNDVKPEVVPWQTIAFCDQTDIMSGPIAIKHYFSPDQLKDMESKGWGNKKSGATGTIDDVIKLSENRKKESVPSGREKRTPGRYIEVYEIHGVFPKAWLDGNEHYDMNAESYKKDFIRQLHITTYYQNKENNKVGICLYKGKEIELPFKFLARDKIYGRALGFGGAEELFEPQVWVNYDIIRIKGMLDQASKVIYQTADPTYANRNDTSRMQNGQILVHEDGKPLTQINTFPVNVTVFENSIREWKVHARQMGAATESILGESPSAGTPFKLQELVTAESHSLHEYRKGKLATFVDEIYMDWIIPHIQEAITKGDEFLSELDLEELQAVSNSLVVCETNKMVKEMILSGENVFPEDIETHKQMVREEFTRGGAKRFIEILKDEMKDLPMVVRINIKGKQKDLEAHTDKLVGIFRQIVAAPQILDDPRMAKLFNEILESSGLSPIDFSVKPNYGNKVQPIQPEQPAQGVPANVVA